ncbi:long-chain fatty acid--CoA ligase [Pseudomonas sp. ICMP22404]|uniref:class I adenylate-forming enzyme family protein n=1 Tax=Pseudomonas sp. ICMP22404 TaxID=2583807 RepID=UPI001119E028|nr:AMP-binding protein [Pseudomonas sp. ICMP22404]TNF83381.1 long-chain fatty acid--CoA ligase [Pseudomonas sp. ICMP22404]
MNTTTFDRSLIAIVDDACETHADETCLEFQGERYTYRQVQQATVRTANALIASGFRKGMKGAVYSQNSAKAFIVMLGIIRAGGAWIPINPRNAQTENISALCSLQCNAVFYQECFAASVAAVEMACSELKIKVSLDAACGGLDDWLADANDTPPDVPLQPNDLVSIPMTGGTTGAAKGVMQSHGNFAALTHAMCLDYEGRPERPVLLCAAPMTHVGGRTMLTSMAAGATFVILDHVDPQWILRLIQEKRISDIFLPPTAISTLLDQPNVRDFDYSSLRAVTSGAAPISIQRLKQAMDVFGPVMYVRFGQTECPMFISVLKPQDISVEDVASADGVSDQRLKSVGRATPISQLAILSEDGAPLPVGDRGEIGVKGPMVSLGYYDNPKETARVRKSGWHLTGDIGYMDEDGFLFIVDRKKDMIISGGFNVYSAEVEQALMSIPGVETAAVIGVPSARWGEEVKAVIKLAAGTQLSAEQIIEQCKLRIGSVKAPKSIDLVYSFPQTALGKLDKKKLRSRYWPDEQHADR